MTYPHLIPAETPLEEITYCAIDLETTGTSFRHDGIVELAILRYKKGEKLITFSQLLNPETKISTYAQNIHGITEEMVKDAPTFQEIADTVYDLTEGCVFVGHSLTSLDLSFLNRELRKAGKLPRFNYTIDTYHLGRYFFRVKRKRGLRELAKAMGVRVEPGHRALPDAQMTLKIWIKALDWFTREGYKTLQDLMIKRLVDSGYTRRGLEVLRVVREHRFLRIVYESPVAGKTERVVEPLAVRGNRLDAYCHLREDFRSFYLQRIVSMQGL